MTFCYAVVRADGTDHPAGCVGSLKEAHAILKSEGGKGWHVDTRTS